MPGRDDGLDGAHLRPRKDYRVAQMRYEAGRSIAVEALDALTARTRAESNVVQALFQYSVARDRLLRAVGDPGLAAQPGTPPGAAPNTRPAQP